jgi:hypothetical protein
MKILGAAVALSVCGVALLSGCIESTAPQAEPKTNVQVIDSNIADARQDHRVLDSQLEILQRARDAGGVTRADVDEAFAKHLSCLDAAGVAYNVVEQEWVKGSGLSMPGVTLPTGDLHSTREVDIDDACMFANDAYVETAYYNQPAAREAEDKVWGGQAMRACLKERGYTVDDALTADEVRTLEQQDESSHWQDPGFASCLSAIG